MPLAPKAVLDALKKEQEDEDEDSEEEPMPKVGRTLR